MNLFKKFSDRIDSLQEQLEEQQRRMRQLVTSVNYDLDTAYDLVDEYFNLIKKPRHKKLEVRINQYGEVEIKSSEEVITSNVFSCNIVKLLLSIDELRDDLKQELYMQAQKKGKRRK